MRLLVLISLLFLAGCDDYYDPLTKDQQEARVKIYQDCEQARKDYCTDTAIRLIPQTYHHTKKGLL